MNTGVGVRAFGKTTKSEMERNRRSSPSVKPQPIRATQTFTLKNASQTRGTYVRRSPSSSPVHSTESYKTRRSPSSPEHRRSPTSPSSHCTKVSERILKNASSTVRRTASLDALQGTYLSCQWPRDINSYYGPSVSHKHTQTPSWDEGENIKEDAKPRHRRSASWGSADLREKLKQHLQRTKQGQMHGRQSPIHGDHTAINTQSHPVQIPTTQKPAAIPIRRSAEGLNSEIEKLVLYSPTCDTEPEPRQQAVSSVPDGHRAPVKELLTSFRNVDTQTTNTVNDSPDSSGSGPSRSQSVSPSSPIMAVPTLDSHSSSRSSSVGYNEENNSPEMSGVPKYASSPKPNNSYLFAREPPDGAEKVPLHVEDTSRKLDCNPPTFGPDKSKVKIIFSKTSPFSALPSVPVVPSLAVKSPGQCLVQSAVERGSPVSVGHLAS